MFAEDKTALQAQTMHAMSFPGYDHEQSGAFHRPWKSDPASLGIPLPSIQENEVLGGTAKRKRTPVNVFLDRPNLNRFQSQKSKEGGILGRLLGSVGETKRKVGKILRNVGRTCSNGCKPFQLQQATGGK